MSSEHITHARLWPWSLKREIDVVQGLTHAQIKRQPAWQRERLALANLVRDQMAGMPARWIEVVTAEWERRRKVDAIAAGRWGWATLRQLQSGALEGVRIGDTDADICNRARASARRMADMLAAIAARCRKARPKASHEHLTRMAERLKAWWVRADFAARGLADLLPVGRDITRRGMLARVADEVFWRRAMRKAHAVMLEAAAIDLGMVRAGRGGCYVSDESLKRRRGQLARNAAALAATLAVNERGESTTLAEVAAKGVADKGVRRAELMTRISGFEVIANEVGHQAVMVTVTCPSRMHKFKRGDDAKTGKANPNFDGTLPKQAQAYLAKQYSLWRSAAARAGLRTYGFRIAEPHHDGCPHWHLLLWYGSKTERGEHAGLVLGLLFLRYFLANESPGEPGAAKRRVTMEMIDPAKGSAVAYVAKYVAKNIDGYRVESDLYGNPAMESSARVEAWASTWRIRQFQQIGGAPVGVWRELRRVHPFAAPMDAPQVLHDALAHVNLSGLDAAMSGPESEAMEAHRIRKGWAAYVMGQGGPTVKRAALAMRVHRDDTGEVGRYGDPKARAVVGVAVRSVEFEAFGIVARHMRQRLDVVESERCSWQTAVMGQGSGARGRVVARLAAVFADSEAKAAHALRENRRQAHRVKRADACEVGGHLVRGEAVRPWTRVNNCTQVDDPFQPKVIHTPKRGQVFKWTGGGHTRKTENVQDSEADQRRSPATHHPG